MCYNFATFVLYLDVITLIYRENRLTSSEPSLSAINVENQQITKRTPNFTPKNVKLGVFILFKNNVEHLQSFDEIKHRHTLNEVGDVAEGKDKHYCNSRFLLTRFNSVLQFMYH